MVAKLPPRGWNSWDCFGAAVNEEQVKANAEYIAANMKDCGYEYVVIDIEWYQPTAGSHEYEPFSELCMDEYGRLIPAENRFPSAAGGKGFKPLADYIHSLGLKLGIHIMRGMPRMAAHKKLPILGSDQNAAMVANPNSICAWNPDMYGLKCETNEAGARAYYESIFALYAEWGVDFIKLDDICREYPHCKREIELISESLRGCGRDMVLSLSPGPAILETSEHLKKYSNMWRITDDFWDQWDLLLNMFERARVWCTHAGPGHWPDADMLPVGALRRCSEPDGWTAFTEAEQRTMMSLWCMMRAPLMVGADLPANDEFTLKLLTNKEVLDIEEKSHCGHELFHTDEEVAWFAPMKDNSGAYLALFNVGEKARTISVSLSDLEIMKEVEMVELWSGAKCTASGEVAMLVEPHDAVIFCLNY